MRVGQARRRDTAEKAIRKALEAVGCDVTQISGEGAPDLLVRRGGGPSARLWAFEVKSGTGKRTDAQQASKWPIIRTVDDALAAVFPVFVPPADRPLGSPGSRRGKS